MHYQCGDFWSQDYLSFAATHKHRVADLKPQKLVLSEWQNSSLGTRPTLDACANLSLSLPTYDMRSQLMSIGALPLHFRFRIELGGRVFRLLRTFADDLADC